MRPLIDTVLLTLCAQAGFADVPFRIEGAVRAMNRPTPTGMSVQDHAAFHWHAFGPDGITGRWPWADLGGGALYSIATFQCATQGTHNYWHCAAESIPGRLMVGGVAATYDVCTDRDRTGALDAARADGVFR